MCTYANITLPAYRGLKVANDKPQMETAESVLNPPVNKDYLVGNHGGCNQNFHGFYEKKKKKQSGRTYWHVPNKYDAGPEGGDDGDGVPVEKEK